MANQQNDDMQKLFIAYLIQISGAKDESELTEFVKSLGEEGLKKAYVSFIENMKQGAAMAKNGAKLNYIKSLRNKCPEGQELEYFKDGGQVCFRCNNKKRTTPLKPLQEEKGTKVVLEFKKEIKDKKDKITLPKKAEKKEFGGIIDSLKCGRNLKKKIEGGLVEKSKKIPIKKHYFKKK